MPNQVRSLSRLQALNRTGQLDSPPEETFDRLTQLASRILHAPIALVSLVDSDRQFFKSQIGLPDSFASCRQTPLTHSFCQHVVESGQPLIVNNAHEDPLVRDNLAVRELGVIAYAGVPLRTIDGHVLGSFCVIDTVPRCWTSDEITTLTDLSAIVTGQLELKAEHIRADTANRAKDRFLAILSHELRTPVSPALMLAGSMAIDVSLPAQVREDSRTIQRNLNQQTRLIDDLLDVTRIENGKLAIHPVPIELNGLLAEVVTTCQADARQKQIALSSTFPDRIFHVEADPARLRQVFFNVIKNAIKFTPPQGQICVQVDRAAENRVMVSVKDTGIGIDPTQLTSIFDAYEQGSRAITDEFSGLGLGLAISKGLVEAHGGSIKADSQGKGTGTTVTVELPASTATIPTPPPVTAPVQAAVAPPPRGLRILLVDDHHDTLSAMSRLLRRLGHTVTPADCVASALAAADQTGFELLISDIGLPDGTGLDLMRELLKRQPICGIALTGYGMDGDIEQTLIAGFSAHLTKPIDLSRLEKVIAGLSL